MQRENSRRFGDFDTEYVYGYLPRLMGKIGVREVLAEAELVADLGSGAGNSAVILRRMSPQADMHTVDVVFGMIHETNKGLIGENHKHYKKSLRDYFDYLITEEKQLDAVLLAAIPDHQLDEEGGYLLFSKTLSEGGLVIEAGDTLLSKNAMQENFDAIYVDEVVNDSNDICVWSLRVWQKKNR